MAETLGTLAVHLKAFTAKFESQMKSATGAVERHRETLQGIGIASAAAAAGIGLLMKSAVDAASDLEEQANLLSVSFGKKLTPAVEKWAETFGDAVGRAPSQMKDFAGNLQAMLVPMTGNVDAAAKMSTKLSQLAVDLGSFNNVADEDALGALRSALAGSTEPMRRFGVVMTQANLQNFAFANGIRRSVQDMTESEKTLLRYNYILENTKLAQGDAARTADGYANVQKALGAELQKLRETLGQALIPMFNSVAKALRDALRWFNQLSPAIQRIGAMGLAAVGGLSAITAAISGVALAIPPVLKGLAAMKVLALATAKRMAAAFFPVIVPIAAIAAAVATLLAGIGYLSKMAKKHGTSLKEVFQDIFATISGWVDTAVKFWSKKLEEFFDFVLKGGAAIVGIASPELGAKIEDFRWQLKVGVETDLGKTLTQFGESAKELGQGAVEFGKGFLDNMKEGASEVSKALGLDKLMEGGAGKGRSVPDVGGDAGLGSLQGINGRAAKAAAEEATKRAAKRRQAIEKLEEEVAQGKTDLAQRNLERNLELSNINDKFHAEQMKIEERKLQQQARERARQERSIGGAAQRVVGSLGQAGQLINSTVRAFQQGGPFAAAANAIGQLVVQTEAFKRLSAVLGKVFESAVKFMEPVVEIANLTLIPQLELFGRFLDALAKAIKKIVVGVINAFIGILKGIDKVTKGIDFDDELRSLREARENIRRGAEPMQDDLPSGYDPVPPLGDLADAATGAAESVDKLNSSITNVPQGFKVAAARFNAESALKPSIMGSELFGGAASKKEVTVNVSGLYTEEAIEKITQAISEKSFQQTGSVQPSAPQYSGTFVQGRSPREAF